MYVEIENNRNNLINWLSAEKACGTAVLELANELESKCSYEPEFLSKFKELHRVKVNNILKELGDCQPVSQEVSRLEAFDLAIKSLPGIAADLGLSMSNASIRAFRELLVAEQRRMKKQPYASRQAEAPAAPEKIAIAAPEIPKPVREAPMSSEPVAAIETPLPAKPAIPVVPPAPPKPKRPPLDWSKVWEKTVQVAVSGALLRGLLYLGAFMIVISATILVVRFWALFPPIIQLMFIFSVPTIFYAAGWVVRSKLKLPQAGNTLSGIGSLLLAVDFAAIYQLSRLDVPVDLYWLAAAVICTLIYAITAWRLAGIFFDYTALIGVENILVATTRVLNLPIEWNILAVTAGSGLMVTAAVRLWNAGEAWRDLARAARYLPQILIPSSLVAITLIPRVPHWALALAYLMSSLSYAALAWRFPGAVFTHAAVWTSLAAIGFGLSSASLPNSWFGVAAALLAAPYTFAAKWIGGRIPPDNRSKASILLAPNLAGFALLLAAIFLGAVNIADHLHWPTGVASLTFSALVLAYWSYLFRRPALAAFAAGLFGVAYSIAVGRVLQGARILQWTDWLAGALQGLALFYLGISFLLRRFDKYAFWMHAWVQILPPISGFTIMFAYLQEPDRWYNMPALVGLAAMMLVYLASAIIHDRGRHPGLTAFMSKVFPLDGGQAVFIWLLAGLLPGWISIAWRGSILIPGWLGAALVVLGLAYLPLGQRLMQRKQAYRLPLHFAALALVMFGVLAAWGDKLPLMSSLYLGVILLAGLAFLHNSILALMAASVLVIFPFQLMLDVLRIYVHAQSIAYALLAGLAYLPLGLWLKKIRPAFATPAFIVGYCLSIFAVLESVLGRFHVFQANLPWVGVLTPLIAAGLYLFSLYRFQRQFFGWAFALALAVVYGELLTWLRLPPEYDATAWAGISYLYLLVSWLLKRLGHTWPNLARLPLAAGSVALGATALLVTMFYTLKAIFSSNFIEQLPPLILAQSAITVLAILWAILYRTRWPAFLVPWLAAPPITLFFIGNGRYLFGAPLEVAQYGLVWMGLGIACLLAATALDAKEERYSHGLYLGGYTQACIGTLWTVFTPHELTWLFGLLILVCAASALSVHIRRHKAWLEVVQTFFARDTGRFRQIISDAFLWAAAWLLPLWCLLLISQFKLFEGYGWLGFSLPPLAFIWLALTLARLQKSYAWPFIAAGQFYTIIALLIGIHPTFSLFSGQNPFSNLDYRMSALAFILVQSCAALYYALHAGIYHKPIFAHVASWLVVLPYSLAWFVFARLSPAGIALPWMWLATALLAAAYVLDQKAVRYTHGPALAGFLLAIMALVWSTSDWLVSVYTLGWSILLALGAQLLVHLKRLSAYTDLLGWLFWRIRIMPAILRTARSLFLFYAVYAFPVWLASLLGYNGFEVHWQGLALVLVAPVYIAAGLVLKRFRKEYTWPLYSAAYALTVIGPIISYENLPLLSWVLALDAVVFGVSAYIFRQSLWLYLSNSLIPVIALIALNVNHLLIPVWVAGIFIALAFLYFAVGRWFDHQAGEKKKYSTFALPFYLLGCLISVASLAVASRETNLAIGVYLAGSALYALSAWAFRESLFLYPAAWLAAVPYYLALSLLPIPRQWYGLCWLPLIVGYILVGRFVFHKNPLNLRKLSCLAQPCMPFYLLAYGLTVSMITLSAGSAFVLTLALTAASAVYIGSAALFRKPLWLYPAILTAHMALLAYFTITPSGAPFYAVSLPFLGVTWLTAVAGHLFSRLYPPARLSAGGRLLFKVWKWELDFGNLPSFGYLATPSWAQPFFVIALIDIMAWQIVALFGLSTTITVALGIALLLGMFAMLWRDDGLAYAALVFALLAAGAKLKQAEFTAADIFAWLSAIGFGMYLVGLLLKALARLQLVKPGLLEVWHKPLANLPVLISVSAVLFTLPTTLLQATSTAASLAFAGALYLAIAYRGRYQRLGYLAIFMLEASWILFLIVRGVRQPQLYAIPAGLYLTLLGYLEGMNRRQLFSLILEIVGLAVLLVTSFLQSLNGAEGFSYFLILLVEGLLVIWWGAARRRKIPFFTGLGSSALNVVAQVIVLITVYEVNRWLIILGVGLALMIVAVFVERSREQLIIQAQAWRDALETWG